MSGILVRRYRCTVSDALPPDAFYQSARDYAQRALQADHAREFHRLPLEAGTEDVTATPRPRR